MFATGLIVFRETLEAALFVGIVAAATRGLERRGLWIAGGVLAGLTGALLLAAGMEKVSVWADGIGQDLLNVGIITLALAMLAWHCVWVSTHGREMAQEARQTGRSAAEGTGSLRALTLAVALAVLREGAETVLFVAGFMSGSAGSGLPMLLGALTGLALGSLAGLLIYLGLARIKTQHLFSVTNALILVLAGSLASQLAKTLIQAGLVVHWSEPLWDGSLVLSNESSLGILLHALMGYDASPSGLQLLFYAGAIGMIWMASLQARNWQKRDRTDAVMR
ncbi:MAG: FTR1 family protein [Rhodoferax sp.]|uniref:FTR1 family iron permease n=1 Tax=Rhodoferax sp. TaxID=50421 RepID=UPI0026335FE0|nr:FTR1 family protein [Rhodoferax sp.]MDD5332342.1 FTR1 family protein [Rhodoferax sp.]